MWGRNWMPSLAAFWQERERQLHATVWGISVSFLCCDRGATKKHLGVVGWLVLYHQQSGEKNQKYFCLLIISGDSLREIEAAPPKALRTVTPSQEQAHTRTDSQLAQAARSTPALLNNLDKICRHAGLSTAIIQCWSHPFQKSQKWWWWILGVSQAEIPK